MFWVITIIVGLLVGLVARFLLPGRDPIGILATMLIGVAGVLIGTWLWEEVPLQEQQRQRRLRYLRRRRRNHDHPVDHPEDELRPSRSWGGDLELRLLRPLACGHLETVVPVRVSPRANGAQGRLDRVRNQEQGTPSFPLTDVGSFVGQEIIVDRVDAQHHLAEGDRSVTPPEPARPRRPLAHEDPIAKTATVEQRRQDQTKQRTGSRPRRPQQPEHRA